MNTVSSSAAQRPGDVAGSLSSHLRTAALLEQMDPAFARAAEELVGDPHRTGVVSPSIRGEAHTP